jgi:hypothetical protein
MEKILFLSLISGLFLLFLYFIYFPENIGFTTASGSQRFLAGNWPL